MSGSQFAVLVQTVCGFGSLLFVCDLYLCVCRFLMCQPPHSPSFGQSNTRLKLDLDLSFPYHLVILANMFYVGQEYFCINFINLVQPGGLEPPRISPQHP